MTSSFDAFVPRPADRYDVIWERPSSDQLSTHRVMLESEVEQLHAASYGWALACCRRDRDEAEEVLQDVYVKILEGKARFDGRSSLKTWLFAVIRRTAAARARRRFIRDLLLAKWARQELDPVQANPHRAAENSQTSAALLGALQRLARRQREVLELVFYHDLTIEEAAAAMNVSIGAARVHYQRGKKQLMAQLDGKLGP
ncbi:MAG TPA: RNA polymerase sigma factor [Thermoanaerobaculia bacterium]